MGLMGFNAVLHHGLQKGVFVRVVRNVHVVLDLFIIVLVRQSFLTLVQLGVIGMGRINAACVPSGSSLTRTHPDALVQGVVGIYRGARGTRHATPSPVRVPVTHVPPFVVRVLGFVGAGGCLGNVLFGDGQLVPRGEKRLVATGHEQDVHVRAVAGGKQKINGLAGAHLGGDIGAPSAFRRRGGPFASGAVDADHPIVGQAGMLCEQDQDSYHAQQCRGAAVATAAAGDRRQASKKWCQQKQPKSGCTGSTAGHCGWHCGRHIVFWCVAGTVGHGWWRVGLLRHGGVGGCQTSSSLVGVAAAITKSFHMGRSRIALRGGGGGSGGGGTYGLVMVPTMIFVGGTGTGGTNAAAVRQLQGTREQLFQQMLVVGGVGVTIEFLVEANQATGVVARRIARLRRLRQYPSGRCGGAAAGRGGFREGQRMERVVKTALVGRSFFKQTMKHQRAGAGRWCFEMKLGRQCFFGGGVVQDVLLATDWGVPKRVAGFVGKTPLPDRVAVAVDGVQKQATVLPCIVIHDHFDGRESVGHVVGGGGLNFVRGGGCGTECPVHDPGAVLGAIQSVGGPVVVEAVVVATEKGGASVTDVDVAGGGARGEGGVEGEEKEEEGCGCSAVHVHVHGPLLCVWVSFTWRL